MFNPTDHILDYADDFLHQLLGEADAAYVEQHCRLCRICEVALEEAQKRFHALQTVPACEASEELIRSTLTNVEQRSVQRRVVRRRFFIGVPSAVAAAVMLLAGSQLYYSNLEASPYDLRVLGQKELVAGARGSLRVQLLDLKSGKALEGVRVNIELVALAGAKIGQTWQLASFATNAAGTGQPRFTLPDTPSGEYELRVRARPHGKTELLTEKIRLKRSWKVMLSSDKPVYQPGQAIQVRALTLLQQTLEPIGRQELVFSVTDPKGNIIFKSKDETSRFGLAGCTCPLATEVNEGAYTIACKVGDTESKRTVEVKKYVLPKFKIDVETDQPYYSPGQTMTGKVRVAYFFGKPVADAEVAIGVQATDAGPRTLRTLNLRTDVEGNVKFVYQLPDLAGREQRSGDAAIALNVTATDSAGQTQTRTVSRTVTQHQFRIEVIPEGGLLVKGVPNKIYVFVSYPDGRPVKKAKVTVPALGANELLTDELGIVSLDFTPDSNSINWITRVRDEDGKTESQTTVLLCGDPVNDFILRTDKAVYDGGKTMIIHALGGGSGTVYLDLIKEGQTVLTDTFDMKDGKAEYHLDLPAELFGTVELYAYRFSNDSGLPVRKSRVLFIRQAGEVSIQTALDKPEYRPGAGAKLQFTLTDRQGKPAPGALSLAAVDEAVFSVLDAAPGMEKTFYLLEQELLKPIYAIYPWSPEFGPRVPEEERDRFEQAIFARSGRTAEIRDDRFFASRVGMPQPNAAKPSLTFVPMPTVRKMPATTAATRASPYSLSLASFPEKAARIAAERAAGLKWVDTGWSVLAWTAVIATVLSILAGMLWTFAKALEATGGPSLVSVLFFCGVLVVICLVSITALGTNASKTFNTVAQQVGAAGGDGFAWRAPAKSAAPPRPMMARDTPVSASAADLPTEPVRVRELFPETLLWKPELITDDQGRATLDLELADSITTWRLSASAVTANGHLGSAQTSIKVFQPFFVDLNLPVTLTRGDEVSIPVVVYNYLAKPQVVELKFETAPWFDLRGEPLRQIDLAPNEVRSLSYRLQVKKVGNHELQVTARGAGVADALKREIEVVPDGKKVEQVVTDRLYGDVAHTLIVPENAVEDSAKLLVKIYPGTFSQVLEGTEGMLRMPFG